GGQSLQGTGTVRVQYEGFGGPDLDPSLSKLATGKLELDVKEAKKMPEKPDPVEEAFTAWGKEVGGLQAGVGFRPGEHRVYHHGETVALVVRVRNVGKEGVTFQYVPRYLMENPPTVTDGDGKPVPLRGSYVSGIFHPSAEVTLAPGTEVELYEWKAELRPVSSSCCVPANFWAWK